MIKLTKEQLADVLREAYRNGFEASAEGWNFEWGCMRPEQDKYWCEKREMDIQTLVNRSSGAQYRERPNHSVHRGHESLPCHCWAESDHSIGKEISRACACADAKRLAWVIEKAQTGSIGFGDFVLYPGDSLDDVRAVIDSAMASMQEDGK